MERTTWVCEWSPTQAPNARGKPSQIQSIAAFTWGAIDGIGLGAVLSLFSLGGYGRGHPPMLRKEERAAREEQPKNSSSINEAKLNEKEI